MLLGIGLDPMELPWLPSKRTKGLGGVTQWQPVWLRDHAWGPELDPQL